jgi:hypothetical protein
MRALYRLPLLSANARARTYRIVGAAGQAHEVRNRMPLCRCGRPQNTSFCKDLLGRLHSPEGRTVADMDLHILRALLQLMANEVVYIQHMRARETRPNDPAG